MSIESRTAGVEAAKAAIDSRRYFRILKSNIEFGVKPLDSGRWEMQYTTHPTSIFGFSEDCTVYARHDKEADWWYIRFMDESGSVQYVDIDDYTVVEVQR